jgi:hypothetical protein
VQDEHPRVCKPIQDFCQWRGAENSAPTDPASSSSIRSRVARDGPEQEVELTYQSALTKPTTVLPRTSSSRSTTDDTASSGPGTPNQTLSLSQPTGDATQAAAAANAEGSAQNPLMGADLGEGPNAYRTLSSTGGAILGCYKFNTGLTATVGVSQALTTPAFTEADSGLTLHTNPDSAAAGFVIVPLAPSVYRAGGDLYFDMSRTSLTTKDAALLLAPSASIAGTAEKLWLDTVRGAASAEIVARKAFSLDSAVGWYLFTAEGKQFTSCVTASSLEPAICPWWGAAGPLSKTSVVGVQMLTLGRTYPIGQGARGEQTKLKNAEGDSATPMTAVLILPAGVKATIITNEHRIRQLRGWFSELFTESSSQ